MTFRDHFSGVADGYARFRPGYPAALFAHLASIAPAHELAVDVGTGSGQAAVSLADHFARVVAVDASEAQLARATPHPRVEYRVSPAEALDLPDGCADLVTTAQSLHWFDVAAFGAEVRRILRPRGLLAVWSYGQLQLPSREMQRIVDRLYHETLGGWWPPERALVEAGYAGLPLPFPDLDVPRFEMAAPLTLDALGGYLRTWSAAERHRVATGLDAVAGALEELAGPWPGAEPCLVRWPLTLRIARAP